MAEFRVVIDGDLSDEQAAKINATIQRGVMSVLAEMGTPSPEEEPDPNPWFGNPFFVLPRPPDWYGMVAARVDPGDVDDVVKRHLGGR